MANAIWPVIQNPFQQNKLLRNMACGMAKRNGIRIQVKKINGPKNKMMSDGLIARIC